MTILSQRRFWSQKWPLLLLISGVLVKLCANYFRLNGGEDYIERLARIELAGTVLAVLGGVHVSFAIYFWVAKTFGVVRRDALVGIGLLTIFLLMTMVFLITSYLHL